MHQQKLSSLKVVGRDSEKKREWLAAKNKKCSFVGVGSNFLSTGNDSSLFVNPLCLIKNGKSIWDSILVFFF